MMELLTFSMMSKSFQNRDVFTNRFPFSLVGLYFSLKVRLYFSFTKTTLQESEDHWLKSFSSEVWISLSLKMEWPETRVWWNVPSRHGMRVCWLAGSPSWPIHGGNRRLHHANWWSGFPPRKSSLSRKSISQALAQLLYMPHISLSADFDWRLKMRLFCVLRAAGSFYIKPCRPAYFF